MIIKGFFMSFIPPVNGSKSVSSAKDTEQPVVKGKNAIEKTVEQSALDKLPPKAEVSKKSDSSWGIWSWLGFGKKEEAPVQVGEPKPSSVQRDKPSSGQEGDLAGDVMGEASSEGRKGEGQLTESDRQTTTIQPQQGEKESELGKTVKEQQLGKAVVKTYQAAQKGVTSTVLGGVGSILGQFAYDMGGSYVVEKYASSYNKFDKEKVVAGQKQEMLDHLHDPQFVEFYEAVSAGLSPIIKDQLIDALAKEKDPASKIIVSQEALILKLLDVILARGFNNLARQVKENAEDIPNFGKQPSLVSVMSLLCQKASKHIDQSRLEGIEKKYQKDQQDLDKHLEKLFDMPASKPALDLYIKEYIKTTDKGRKEAIKKDLFPNLDSLQGQKAKDVQAFFTTLENLRLKNQEIHQLFNQVSEDILLFLFPNKLSDIKELDGWGSYLFGNMAFNAIRDSITDLLQDSYEPVANNTVRNEAQEKNLKEKLGAPDLKPVVQAPSAFLLAFGKNFIQRDPAAMETMVGVIDNIVHPSAAIPLKNRLKRIKEELKGPLLDHDKAIIESLEAELDKIGQKDQNLQTLKAKKLTLQQLKTPEARAHLVALNKEIDDLVELQKSRQEKRKNTLNQMSEQQLANWVVESMQSMLNTEDANLLGLGQFVKQLLNNLTLTLMSKGANLVIPEGEQVEPKAFIKEFSDRLIEKVNSLKGDEAFSEQFWKDFVNDLPLPPLAKQMLLPAILEKGKSLQAELRKKAPDFQEIQKVHEEANKKIRGYEGGAQLLSVIEKVSDQIIEQVLEKNIDLVSTLGLGDTLEELFVQYLPGVTINEDLKMWFKENISALGVTEGGQTPRSIVLLKQGIQAVMQKAMVNTIEQNFKNNSKDYAAQLLQNFQSAFSKAFKGFDDVQRKQLDTALGIQVEIDKKNEQLLALKEQITKKPTGITSEQTVLLDDVVAAHTRLMRATDYVDNLKGREADILATLNQRQKKKVWKEADLPFVSEALVIRQIELPTYSSTVEYVSDLKNKIGALSKKEGQGALSSVEKKELDQRRLLLILIEMAPPLLKDLSQAVNVHATLQHAEKELTLLEGELKNKESFIAKYEKGNIRNLKEWNAAKTWMQLVLTSKPQIKQIYQEMEKLEVNLDAQLGAFKLLSKELTALLGLDKKDKLELPPFLQDQVWPLIESAQDKQIARLLFTQVAPLLVSVKDAQKNKDRLQELSNGNPFLGQLIHAATEDIISRIPEYVTSYKPLTNEMLMAIGVDKPTEAEVVRMESSLAHTLVELGKEGTTPTMLKSLVKEIVPQGREEVVSQSIADLIPQWNDAKQPHKEILNILKKEIKTTNRKEERNLEKQAEGLAKSINQFLFNRGKANLEPKHLVEAYDRQVTGTQSKIAPIHVKAIQQKLQQKQVVEKIKAVVITPEEIAIALNDAIPGATDLHHLVAPQLQAVIVGQDPAFQANREVLQQFLEGTILRLFVKIAEANKGKLPTEDPLTVITGKLKELAKSAIPEKGQTAEEAAREMIDQVLEDIMDIHSKEDFGTIPASLQQLAFDKVKEQAYQQLTPLVLPIIERNQNRVTLQELSGSEFLGSLCEALSKDVFTFVPSIVKSYHAISEELLTLLADGKKPTADQVDQFAGEIAQLAKNGNVKHRLLAQAFAKITHKTLNRQELEKLEAKLDQRKAADDINYIMITPEQIASSIGALFPHFDAMLQKTLANEMQKLIQGGTDTYLNGASFASAYIEGILLRVFIDVAKKNPKQLSRDPSIPSKDSMVVLSEKLLDVAAAKYQETKGTKNFKQVAQELNDTVMKEILGIDSPAVFKGLPDALQVQAYEAIKDQLGGLAIRIHERLSSFDSSSKQMEQAKETAKKFGIDDKATKSYAQILSEDIANMAVDSVPHVLTEISGENMKGVVNISKGLEGYLEFLSKGNVQMAKVLLGYAQSDQFKQMLEKNLGKVADKQLFVEDKKKAADLLGNLLLEPMNIALDKAIQFEAAHKKQFNQKLMANLLHVAAGHLKNLNAAKELAGKEGREILHEDFLKVAGKELHPAVPKAPVTYQKTLDAIAERLFGTLTPDQEKQWLVEQDQVRKLIAETIKDEYGGAKVITLDDFIQKIEPLYLKMTGKALSPAQRDALKAQDQNGLTLRDLMRQETDEPFVQRQKEFYGKAIDSMLNMVFPNGQHDLTFVPEEFRSTVWTQFKQNLFPIVLPMITEIVLDPAMINQMVLSGLQNMNLNLAGEIEIDQNPEPADLPLDELDQASGELIAECLKAATLPGWAKKMIIDPKTGEISDAMKKTMGATLRSQFNDTFIKDKLNIALKNAVTRDEHGQPMLRFDARPQAIKQADAIKQAEKMEADLKKVTRESVNVSISYFVRSSWAQAQAKFDQAVAKHCGNVGTAIKKFLDLVFGVLFFKIIGTLLFPLTWLIKKGVQQTAYSILSLDTNRKNLLELFTKVPIDQPEAGTKQYAVFHEDLVYKMGDAMIKTVEDFIENEPILPMAKKHIPPIGPEGAAAA